jgi:hypothetical protein
MKCNSNILVRCISGFRISDTDCGSKFCITGPVGICALSALEDNDCKTRCTDGYCDLCVSGLKISCYQNYRDAQEVCPAGTTCVELQPDRYATCKTP